MATTGGAVALAVFLECGLEREALASLFCFWLGFIGENGVAQCAGALVPRP